VKNAAALFPLEEVQLLESPFKQAMERNATYLLGLEPDRLMYNTRKYAGLEPKGEIYGGWEKRGIAGHTLGHYLTAISHQYAATGDKRFKDRIDYTIAGMAECQNAYGDGYIGGLPPTELGSIRALKQGNAELKGWVPWYTQHKVLAGLVDAWVLGKNDQAKQVALKLADWVDDVTAPLAPEQVQHMLRIEHGGMLETLLQIYHLTGNPKYLETSQRFYHHAIFDPLLAGKDDLDGKHANTQIPKITGLARKYEVTGDADARKSSEFFWDTVVHNRSWATGGNSAGEHFFPVGRAHEHLSPWAAESCNTYNMLKLTEHLLCWEPTVERADYYERALYNHILGSEEPEKGMFMYFISLRPGDFKTYSTPYDSFWCCVGTGMENHTKYGEAIYLKGEDGERLYVNLFIPSVLTWTEKGLVLEQRTHYPNEETTELTIQQAPETALPILVRCPLWTVAPVSFEVNGNPIETNSKPGQYAEITRVWKKGDRLRITFPMGLRTEKLEGSDKKVAFFYGPVLLAGDLGKAKEVESIRYSKGQSYNGYVAGVEAPVLVPGRQDLLRVLKRVSGSELAFRTEGIGRPTDVTLRPFNALFYEYYNVYWDVLSEADWQKRKEEDLATKESRFREEARIADEIKFGEQQSEADHDLQCKRSRTGDFYQHKWREVADGGFVEFQMMVPAGALPLTLRCNYRGGDVGCEFDLMIDGALIATQKLENNKRDSNIDYSIPAKLTADKEQLTVRIQPVPGKNAGGFFGVSLLKP
jgi:hypothetical protein